MIAYHATSAAAAAVIRREGFRAGTYFARKREDAAQFGAVILTAWFDDDPTLWHGEPEWQFWLRDSLGPESLVE